MNEQTDLHYDVIIIGAGPAGLAAAIESSRRGLSCIVLDRNKKPGRKLYATGNGRCNLCNDIYNDDAYFGSSFASEIMNNVNLRDFTLDFIHKLGIETVCINGYYYPLSRQSSTVVWGLRDAAIMSGAEICCNSEVEKVDIINTENDKPIYRVHVTGNSVYTGSGLIIASGSPSGPECGAPDERKLYSVINDLKLEFKPYRASLCPVICKDDFDMPAGIRTDALISVPTFITDDKGNIINKSIKQERGELQINENCLSGIVIFNLAEYIYDLIIENKETSVKQQSDPGISINLIPDISEDIFLESFSRLKSSFPERKFVAFLNGFIHDKLSVYFENILIHKKLINRPGLEIKDIPDESAGLIYKELISWQVQPEGLMGYDRSQASSGGIITECIDSRTMSVKGRRGLYAAGEAIDVLGKCGGYNISFALYTGSLAGKNVLKDDK